MKRDFFTMPVDLANEPIIANFSHERKNCADDHMMNFASNRETCAEAYRHVSERREFDVEIPSRRVIVCKPLESCSGVSCRREPVKHISYQDYSAIRHLLHSLFDTPAFSYFATVQIGRMLGSLFGRLVGLRSLHAYLLILEPHLNAGGPAQVLHLFCRDHDLKLPVQPFHIGGVYHLKLQ